MANVSTSTNCDVNFTDEEKEVLQKASEICKSVADKIWQEGDNTFEEDAASFFLSQIGGSIENALKGCYWSP